MNKRMRSSSSIHKLLFEWPKGMYIAPGGMHRPRRSSVLLEFMSESRHEFTLSKLVSRSMSFVDHDKYIGILLKTSFLPDSWNNINRIHNSFDQMASWFPQDLASQANKHLWGTSWEPCIYAWPISLGKGWELSISRQMTPSPFNMMCIWPQNQQRTSYPKRKRGPSISTMHYRPKHIHENICAYVRTRACSCIYMRVCVCMCIIHVCNFMHLLWVSKMYIPHCSQEFSNRFHEAQSEERRMQTTHIPSMHVLQSTWRQS